MATPGTGATNLTVVQVDGQSETVGATAITTLMRNPAGLVLMCAGPVIPAGAGYAKAAFFLKTDVAAGTGALYSNKGDTVVASFTLVTQA